MRLFTTVFVAGGILVSGGRAGAQERVPLEKWAGFDLLTGSLDGGAATSQGTGERVWGGQISVGAAAYGILSVRADGAIVGMKDNESFTVDTNLGERSSSLAAGVGSLSAGLRTPFLGLVPGHAADVSAGVSVGNTWISATRTVSQCIDCPGDTLHFRAGTFWEPGVQLFHGRHGASARYRVYGKDADLRNSLMIGYVWRAGKEYATPDPRAAPPAP
ncbi:MAG TPA: hypothetical protein VFJ16_25125 [Longimicrobium sp.]|nr:hypothetical protein [Longimicrobium sp.]